MNVVTNFWWLGAAFTAPNMSIDNFYQGPHASAVFIGGVVGLTGFPDMVQSVHSRTHCSISRSMPGHHTHSRHLTFILTIPGWPSCFRFSTCHLRSFGKIARLPHTMQPSGNKDSSSLTVWYGFIRWSNCTGQPSIAWILTCLHHYWSAKANVCGSITTIADVLK